MKQSTRLRMIKEYHEHPLRKQYEREKENLKAKSPIRHLLNLILAIPFAMIIVFGVLTFGEYELFGPGSFLVYIVLGIVNLVVCLFLFVWTYDQKEKLKMKGNDFKRLKEKYEQKGLYEITEQELLNAQCAELDSYDDWVCSVTGERLSSVDSIWCLQEGNCKHCRRFVEAYIGSTDYWSYEIKR